MQLLAYAFAAIALLGMIGTGVYKVKQWGGNEVRAEWSAANEKARAEEAARSAAAAAALLAERAKRRVVIQKRTQYVDRYIKEFVDSGTCVKPAGVLCINGAINGDKGQSGCVPDGALPPSKPPG